MTRNVGYVARRGDLFDLSQLTAVPYVDAVTLDKTTSDFYRRAEKALQSLAPPFSHNCRVFRGAKEVLEWIG